MKKEKLQKVITSFKDDVAFNYFFEKYYFLLLFLVDIAVKYFFCNFNVTGYCLLNTGSSWSLFANVPYYSFYVVILSILVLLLMFIYEKKVKSLISSISFNLFAAGILGNTLNRITQGGVIDILYLPHLKMFGIFNLADCFLAAGIIFFLYYEYSRVHKKKKKKN